MSKQTNRLFKLAFVGLVLSVLALFSIFFQLSTNTTSYAAQTRQGSDVTISKTAPDSVAPGETITYELTIRNHGSTATEIWGAFDKLPHQTIFVSASHDGFFNEEDGVVYWPDQGSLGAGESLTLELVVRVPTDVGRRGPRSPTGPTIVGGADGIPTVFTRVSSYESWISSNMSNTAVTATPTISPTPSGNATPTATPGAPTGNTIVNEDYRVVIEGNIEIFGQIPAITTITTDGGPSVTRHAQ